jgi:hypothetical protein
MRAAREAKDDRTRGAKPRPEGPVDARLREADA